jgi:hypothetical protein
LGRESWSRRLPRNVTALVCAALREHRGADERHLDPVCRIVVGEGREAGGFRHHETECGFCSQECLRRFLDAPDADTRRKAPPLPIACVA